MRSVSVPIEPVDDIHVNLASFTRSLRATNLSPRTIQLPSMRLPSDVFGAYDGQWLVCFQDLRGILDEWLVAIAIEP